MKKLNPYDIEIIQMLKESYDPVCHAVANILEDPNTPLICGYRLMAGTLIGTRKNLIECNEKIVKIYQTSSPTIPKDTL